MRQLVLAGATAAALAIAPAPAEAEFFSLEQLQGLCRGDTGEAAEFRTDASRRLLAETYRARCRMYLLGHADASLDPADRRRCIGTASDGQVADALAEAVLSPGDAQQSGVGDIVRGVLRNRYGCRLR